MPPPPGFDTPGIYHIFIAYYSRVLNSRGVEKFGELIKGSGIKGG